MFFVISGFLITKSWVYESNVIKAYVKIPVINNWGKYGDFSYGIYIWFFLVQQTIVFFFKDKLDFVSYNIVVFFITLFIAVCSYHLVEKPMLKLKNIDISSKFKNLFKI